MMTENALTLTPPPLTPIQTPLLQPKLHLPRLHTNLVERERLLTLLDASLERKLTLITAPPGFGKTTLLLQWLAHQNTPDSFAWVALDAGDNDPIRFWRYVLTACQSFQSDHGHEVLHQLSTIAPSPFEPSPLETVLTTFLNALTRHAYDGILILEDYHLITSPYIHQTITFLLDHLPPTLHLILLSRSDPPLPLARLRARGDLCEIHTAELRFSQEETLTFLQQNLSLPSYTLSPQMIRQLDIHLEGWAAGLRLLTFALRGNKSQQEVERILATFTSNHPAQRPIQDYFAAHVHSPFSGQGLNLGIGDAVNLGWKLGATVQGWAPEGLLDTYTSERHPIGAWVLDWTRAQVAVMRGDAYSHSLRGVVTDFLGTRDGTTYYVKRISGLWQRYDLGNGHPLVGTTMPNLRLDDGTRLSDHTHEGRSLLVDLTGDDRLAALARPYAGRLELVRGRSNGAGVSGLLVRPDGFVAWASADGASDSPGLEAALTRWLGDGMGRSN